MFNGLNDSMRLPPQNTDAEEWVLSALMLDNSLGDEPAVARLKPDDFYRAAHSFIFAAIRDMLAASKPVDAMLVCDELERRGQLADVGGIEGLAAIANSAPHAANGAYHAEIVSQKATTREVIRIANDLLDSGYSNEFTSEQLVERAETAILALGDAEAKGETVRIDAVMPLVFDAIDARKDGDVTGLESGLSDLDGVTTGFQPESLIYLAGRTSMGKTALAVNIAEHIAVNRDLPVLFVSLEMSRIEIGERLLIARSGVDGHKVRTGQNLGPREMQKLSEAYGALRLAPMFLDDTPGRTVGQIIANARRLRKREAIQFIVIDLINHIEGDKDADSRREQMCVISRRLKGLARELSIPVMVLAQLNRGPDNREGNRPRKSDLKECGNLEEDADVILLLHRPEYYDANDRPGQAIVIVDKNRNGPTRDVPVVFQRNIMRFDNLSPVTDPPIDVANF